MRKPAPATPGALLVSEPYEDPSMMTDMPTSKCPFPKAAFSARPVMSLVAIVGNAKLAIDPSRTESVSQNEMAKTPERRDGNSVPDFCTAIDWM
jgi:hypothetical protein